MGGADDGARGTTAARSASWRRRAAIIVFVGFLSLQIVIPLIKLFEPRPAPFGWQMFGGFRPVPTFTLVKQDGTRVVLQPHEYYFHRRAHIQYEDYLPPCACRIHPEGRAVEIDRGDGSPPEVYECRR